MAFISAANGCRFVSCLSQSSCSKYQNSNAGMSEGYQIAVIRSAKGQSIEGIMLDFFKIIFPVADSFKLSSVYCY